MNNATRLKRLRTLHDMLMRHSEIFPNVAFDICTWKKEVQAIHPTCGSAACALGSAAMYRPFKKLGLKIKTSYISIPVYKGKEEFQAGQKFFGISLDESLYLFDPCLYKNDVDMPTTNLSNMLEPFHVAERVKKLIKWYEKNTRQPKTIKRWSTKVKYV